MTRRSRIKYSGETQSENFSSDPRVRAMFPQTIALLRARFTQPRRPRRPRRPQRPGAAARGGQSPVGKRQDVRLAVEMFNGRRTVRCQQCKTHLYVPPTSPTPFLSCKMCWCLMVDPLFAPARNASSSRFFSLSGNRPRGASRG